MSIKDVDRLKHYCYELLAAIKINNEDLIRKWLNELEEENNEGHKTGWEFKINYLIFLHRKIGWQIKKIRRNLKNPKDCVVFVNEILKVLNNIVDQREVRDKIIKEVVHPILKSWGYKKKARAFVKQEKNYFKKLNVFTSQFCDYYEVDIRFEVTVRGPEVEINNQAPVERWFKITQDANLEKIKAEIEVFLSKIIKPFLDKYQ